MKKLDIGIDLDGCAYPFHEAMRRYAIEIGYAPSTLPDPGKDPANYANGFYSSWGWDEAEFEKVFRKGVADGYIFFDGEPFPGAIETIQALHRGGHYIHVVTNRNLGRLAHTNTVNWLEKYNIPFDSLMFVARKHLLVGLDLMIDDNPQNFREMQAEGIDVYLYDRPWNQDVDAAEKRITAWLDFELAAYKKAGWK